MQRSRYFRIDWVLGDQLAIGPAPRTERHLNRLREAGIHCILSLCGPDEATPPARFDESFRTSRYVLPDHRAGRLPTLGGADLIALALRLSIFERDPKAEVDVRQKKRSQNGSADPLERTERIQLGRVRIERCPVGVAQQRQVAGDVEEKEAHQK